jgi:hypothetical protein
MPRLTCDATRALGRCNSKKRRTRLFGSSADLIPGERVRDVVVVVLGAALTGLAAPPSTLG